MTLVLTVVSPNVVLQASDRRVTVFRNRRIERRDDDRNKAVLYCDRVAFSYTGPAEMGGISTDEWIARRLAEAEKLEDGFVNLKESATRAYRDNPKLRPWPFRIVAGGWRYMPPDGSLAGFAADIRNTDETSQKLEDRFTWNYEMPPTPRSMGLFTVGRPVPPRERWPLKRALATAANREASVAVAVRLLVEAIRKRAGADHAVGADVMVFCIPRSAVGPADPTGIPARDFRVWEGRVEPGGPSFMLFPAGSNTHTAVLPTFACAGALFVNGVVRRASEWQQ